MVHLTDPVPEVRAAAVNSLGTLLKIKVFDSSAGLASPSPLSEAVAEFAGTLEYVLGMCVLSGLTDASPL
jgi:hypothetical protein